MPNTTPTTERTGILVKERCTWCENIYTPETDHRGTPRFFYCSALCLSYYEKSREHYAESCAYYSDCGDSQSEREFADPSGVSALRASSARNPRNLPCACGTENVLTPADRQRGYQCDTCADQAEMGFRPE